MSAPDQQLPGGTPSSRFSVLQQSLHELQQQHRAALEECVVPGIGSIMGQVVTAASAIPQGPNVRACVYRKTNGASIEVGVRLSDSLEKEPPIDVLVYIRNGHGTEPRRPFQPSDAAVLAAMVVDLEAFSLIEDAPLSSDLTQIAAPDTQV